MAPLTAPADFGTAIGSQANRFAPAEMTTELDRSYSCRPLQSRRVRRLIVPCATSRGHNRR
jgi:hypothetical protein